jgi:hypothetical protein
MSDKEAKEFTKAMNELDDEFDPIEGNEKVKQGMKSPDVGEYGADEDDEEAPE